MSTELQDLTAKYEALVASTQQMKVQRDRYKDEVEQLNNTRLTAFSQQRRLQMNNTQNTFSGNKNENVNDWLSIVEDNMKIANVPQDDYVLVASTYLRQNALQFYQSIRNTNPDWAEYREQFKEYFLPPNYQQILYDKLSNLKCKESIQDYIRDFNYTVNQIEDLPEIQKIFSFRQNLATDTKGYLGLQNPQTLQQAQQMATAYEAHVKNKLFTSDPTIGYLSTKNNKFCSNCKKNNHWTNECFRNKSNNNYKYDNNKYDNNKNYQKQNSDSKKESYSNNNKQSIKSCSYCKKTGHIIDDCYKRKNNNNQNRQTQNNNNNNQNNQASQQTNIIETNKIVSIKSVGTNHKLMNTTALINRIEMDVIFDSGATQSVIPFEIIKKHGIPYNKSNITCQLGDGESIEVIGITQKLEVIVHGSYAILEFIILPRRSILLGYDWFCATNSGIFPHTNTLVFDRRNVKLETEEDTDNELNCLITEIDVNDDDNDELIENQSQNEWIFNNESCIPQYNPILSTIENKSFQELINSHQDTFAKSLQDLEKPCTIGTFQIKLIDETPIFQYPYRKSIAEREEIKLEIAKMLKANIIRPSCSPYSSPVLLINKPGGTKRFCVDYRKLNKATIQDQFPMPRIDDIFDRFNGSDIFSEFDFNSAFWSLAIDPKDIEKTTFSTPDAHYEFLRLPFGVTNGTRAFSRLMFTIFGDLSFIQLYLDNLIVHSIGIPNHFEHIKVLLTRVRKYNLKLNFKKCKFFQIKIKLLGHIISKNTISMDPEKIEKIKNWPIPKNSKNVSSFLGFSNYYNHFISHFSEIAAPLYHLLQKDIIFKWCEECVKSFEDLKTIMCSYPVLRQPDFLKQFILYTDASAIAAGAILSQNDENGEYVVSYGSKKFKNNEIHYSVSEKECLAVLWAVKHYHIYLAGTEFTIVTDHKALQWLMDINEPTGRLARWSIYLQAYNFKIIHRAGIKHTNADAMSRIYNMEFIDENIENNIDYSQKSLDIWEDASLLHYLKTGKYSNGSSKKQIKRIKDKSIHYKLDSDNDKIWYVSESTDKFKLLEVPKPEDRDLIIKQAHLLGHTNARRTFDRLKDNFYWKNMMQNIDDKIRNCIPCLKHKRVTVKEHPAIALPINKIFDRIGIDLVLGLPETEEGFIGIMVITEYLTKYPYAVPIKTKTALEISDHLIQYFSLFGPPAEILTDQGREFVNQIVDDLIKSIGIEHTITSSYHPRTDGLCERYNQTLIRSLRKHADENKLNWHKWLPYCLMAYRDTIQSSTGFTPYQLLFGRDMNKFINYDKEENKIQQTEIAQRLEEIKTSFEDTIPKAIENIKIAQKQQIITQNSAHHIQDELLKIGDEVYIVVKKLHSKMEPDYLGPYFIDGITKHKNYWLKDTDNKRLKGALPLSRLKLKRKLTHLQIEPSNDTPSTSTPNILKQTVLPLCDNTDETFYKIEKILKNRIRNKKKEFFVKWENLPETENSWVKAKDFQSKQTIKDYFENKKVNKIKISTIESINFINLTKNENFNENYQSYTQTHHNQNNWNLLIKILLLALLITKTNSIMISDNFKYCQSHSNTKILDIDYLCNNIISQNEQIIQTNENINLFILSKLHHIVNGIGYECKKQVKIRYLSENIFSYKSSREEKFIIALTEEDCQYMVATKKCENEQMTCDDQTCHLEIISKQKHIYLNTIEAKDYTCSILPRLIVAETTITPLFGHSNILCNANQLFCKLTESTIIWTNNIIHLCPFEIIENNKFTIEKNNIIINESLKMLLQVNGITDMCDTTLFTTTEGLFIFDPRKYNSSLIQNLKSNHLEVKELDAVNQLILTDEDFQTRQLLIVNKLININVCKIQQSMIRSLAKHVDEYHIINNQDEYTILYSNGKNVFIPSCIVIPSITLIENTINCYSDLPIEFSYNNITKYGYLTPDLIIKDTSTLKCCNSTNDFINLPKSNRIIQRIKNILTIQMQNNENILKISLLKADSKNINFRHNPHILDTMDYISQFQKIITIKEETRYLKIIEDSPSNLIISDILNKNDFHKELTSKLMWYALPYLIPIIITITIKILILICIFKYIIKCCKNLKLRTQENDEPENKSNWNKINFSLTNCINKMFKNKINRNNNNSSNEEMELNEILNSKSSSWRKNENEIDEIKHLQEKIEDLHK